MKVNSKITACDSFWVVMLPTPSSTLEDTCFQTTLKDFAAMVRGGLDESRLMGFYMSEKEAKQLAKTFLARVKA